MSDEITKIITTNLLPLSAMFALCFILYQSRLMASSAVEHVHQIGGDGWKKLSIVNRAVFNFYLVVALVLITAIRFLLLIQDQLFIAILVTILAGLGVKLSTDLRTSNPTDEDNSKKQNPSS